MAFLHNSRLCHLQSTLPPSNPPHCKSTNIYVNMCGRSRHIHVYTCVHMCIDVHIYMSTYVAGRNSDIRTYASCPMPHSRRKRIQDIACVGPCISGAAVLTVAQSSAHRTCWIGCVGRNAMSRDPHLPPNYCRLATLLVRHEKRSINV